MKEKAIISAMDNSGNLIKVELIGEREILRDGNPCKYSDLSYDEMRYYDRIADDIYDLPRFDGEKVISTYNKFTAIIPAVIV